jgi:hypothetical protein
MSLIAVMHASPHNARSRFVQHLCEKQNIPVKIYSPPWQGLLSKITTALQASRELTDASHILFIDAYDIVPLARPDVIMERFAAFQHPFVMNAEPHIWPPNSFTPEDYPPCESVWRYLNSGAFLAEREYLRECLERWGNPFGWPSGNDQDWYATHFLKEPGCIKLDTKCELFQCLIGGWWAFDTAPGKLHNTKTNTDPVILHHNGGGSLAEDRILKVLR